MKRTIIISSVILVSVASCNLYSSDLSKVQWVPTYLDIARKDDVKTILLVIDTGITATCPGKPEDWSVEAVVNDSNKIAKIKGVLQTAGPDMEEWESWWKQHPDWKVNYYKYGGEEGECWKNYMSKMLFIDGSNRGFILGFDADSMSKKVDFCGGTSEKLFEVIEDQNSWNSVFDISDEIDINDVGITGIEWLPTIEDFECNGTKDIKVLIFLENDANEPENCAELGRITDPEKIKEFMKALGENVKEPGWEGKIVKMAIINEKNQGMIRKIALDYTNKKVLSFQHYSEKAFGILKELKIIKNEKGS